MIVEVQRVKIVSHVRVGVEKYCSVLHLFCTGRVALERQLVGQNGVCDLDINRVLQSQNLSLIMKSLLFYYFAISPPTYLSFLNILGYKANLLQLKHGDERLEELRRSGLILGHVEDRLLRLVLSEELQV